MDLITFLGLAEGEQWEEFSQDSIFLAKVRGYRCPPGAL